MLTRHWLLCFDSPLSAATIRCCLLGLGLLQSCTLSILMLTVAWISFSHAQSFNTVYRVNCLNYERLICLPSMWEKVCHRLTRVQCIPR
ncbi:hypothetical protein P389DRAFT_35772 [Cystobasidium minutum MCA 4210]|uniref:uncharacterized protein n=1 Tax=Cystobasidium minutum MCA 4210 TaxID=1397322 RepID=UPI0034CD2808|eukprot:jgi/Rhomi1/35772/CE35771_8